MNLRQNQITVGEVLQNPRANALLRRELPMLFKNRMMLEMAKPLTLQQVINRAAGRIPQVKINSVLYQLQQI